MNISKDTIIGKLPLEDQSVGIINGVGDPGWVHYLGSQVRGINGVVLPYVLIEHVPTVISNSSFGLKSRKEGHIIGQGSRGGEILVLIGSIASIFILSH